MSNKDHRSGGKFGGTHTTVIPAAGFLADEATKQQEVGKVVLGLIKAGLKSVDGQRRAKFALEPGSVSLSVRDNTTHQEVRVMTSNVPKTSTALARAARNKGFHISFAKQNK